MHSSFNPKVPGSSPGRRTKAHQGQFLIILSELRSSPPTSRQDESIVFRESRATNQVRRITQFSSRLPKVDRKSVNCSTTNLWSSTCGKPETATEPMHPLFSTVKGKAPPWAAYRFGSKR